MLQYNNSPALHHLVRQSGDPHALTRYGVWHHGGGGVTHGDARQRLRHRHRHWGHRNCHRCHRNRWCHPLGNGLCKGSWEGGYLRVEVGWWGCRWGSISWGRRRGAGRSYKVLLGDRPRLQSSAAQSGVSLGDAMIVGTYCTHRGRQTLLRRCRSGGQRHHLGLASKLGVLLQKNLICGDEIWNLRNTRDMD